VIKNMGEGKYQAQLRTAAGANMVFYSRRSSKGSNAKRDAELLLGSLTWVEPPARLKESEPEVSSVAYYNG
jgi:hypothetical protein